MGKTENNTEATSIMDKITRSLEEEISTQAEDCEAYDVTIPPPLTMRSLGVYDPDTLPNAVLSTPQVTYEDIEKNDSQQEGEEAVEVEDGITSLKISASTPETLLGSTRSFNDPSCCNESHHDEQKETRMDQSEKLIQSRVVGTTRDLFTQDELCFSKKDGYEDWEEDTIFGEDAYSLLGTTPMFSQTAAFAWFVIILQDGMLLVTLMDLIDFSEEGYSTNGVPNRMEMPAGSSAYVTVAQFLGLMLTVLVMAAEGDLVLGLSQILKGYNERIQEKCPNVTYGKWLFAGLFQAAAGALLLFNSFILSMRSTTVIDLALNLTGLYFLQEVDEKAFSIAKETGLLGTEIREECEHVQQITHFTTFHTRRKYLFWKRCMIGMMTVALMLPYAIVVIWQNSGRFMCKTLYIQFGDAFHPEMAHYSGLFHNQGFALGNRIDGRAYYVDQTRTYQMGYCKAEQAWTVSRLDSDTCNYLFKSPETVSYNVIRVANTDWVVSTPTAGDVPATWFKVRCNDCSEDTCNSEFGNCSEDNTQCLCNEGRFGVNCQFKEKCMWFALDQRTRTGLASIPGTAPLLSQEYVSASYATNLSFYDRPIYVPSYKKTFQPKREIDSFIIFTGRRWIIYAVPPHRQKRMVAFHGKPSNWTGEVFLQDMEKYNTRPSHPAALEYLHDELKNYFPIFYSTPVDYGEETDGVDPSTVNWMFAKALKDEHEHAIVPYRSDENRRVDAKLLCSDCESGTGCQNEGYCASSGVCICPIFYAGYQCERVKDCVEAGGCNGAGTCIRDTRTCECKAGSFGPLCELGANALEDEFLCTHCNLHGQGECVGGTFSQECTCQEGYFGVFCNETDTVP